MDSNTEAKPRVYTAVELEQDIQRAQNTLNIITRALPAAATLYAATYCADMRTMDNQVVANQVFDLASAIATRLQEHLDLDVARLMQAKEDSGL